MPEMSKVEIEQAGTWRVQDGFLVAPNGRVMAERTETVAVLYDLCNMLNELEAYKALTLSGRGLMPHGLAARILPEEKAVIEAWCHEVDALEATKQEDGNA